MSVFIAQTMALESSKGPDADEDTDSDSDSSQKNLKKSSKKSRKRTKKTSKVWLSLEKQNSFKFKIFQNISKFNKIFFKKP